MEIENVFEPSQDYLITPIYEFGTQIISLHRYWKFSNKKIEKHIETLKTKPAQLIKEFKELVEQYKIEKNNGVKHDKETAFFHENDWTDEELLMDFEENEGNDITLFPKLLAYSVSASISKLFIGMLDDVTETILSDSNNFEIINENKFWYPKKKFEEELGNLTGKSFSAQENKVAQRLEAFSRLGLDLESEIDELTENLRNNKNSDLDFLEAYFQEIAELTGRIESGCINYYKNKES